MRKHKLLYHLPNLHLARTTLLLWINTITKLIDHKKKLKDMTIELSFIVTSLKVIKLSLEKIVQDSKSLASHVGKEAQELDKMIDNTLCSIVLECEDKETVQELLNILSELTNESFTKQLSL